MRLHTDILNLGDLYDARRLAVVSFDVCEEHGSKSRDHSFDVKLEGSSGRYVNSGTHGRGDIHAATWDEWGIFLGHLFSLDPHMTCWAYTSGEDFHYKTGDRFRLDENLAIVIPSFQHKNHRWVNGVCKCGSIRRYASLPTSVPA